jgi:cell division protein FtsB
MMRMRGGWYWTALALFAVALVAYVRRHDLIGLYYDYRYSQDQVKQLEARLTDLDKQESALRQHVEDLDRDPLAVETEVRRSKGLVREGEKIFRVELPAVTAP